ncbi:WD domain, G-beta repeat [Novymonas esmeraldas]|uniref:WD domain, G-beta repeat n=1 Tax=Novymonas esmeraldas TaxID=1808958 RepID=A0AAW0F4Z8_9TRYP
MDLAEKRKQLEALRAARQAKQQVVDQYMSGRLSNHEGSPTSSSSLTSAVVASVQHAVGARPTATSSASSPTAPRSPPRRRLSNSDVGRNAAASTTPTAAAPSAASPTSSASPTTPPLSTAGKPPTPLPARQPGASSAAAPRVIQVVAVHTDATAPPPAHPAAGVPSAVVVPPLHTPRGATSSSPVADGAAAAATTCGGWGLLHNGARHALRDTAGAAAATQPTCIFNPSVLLGDVAGSVDSRRRRVIADSVACLVPYDGVAASYSAGERGYALSPSPPVPCVCVAAAYGADDAAAAATVAGTGGGGGGGGNSGDLAAHPRHRGSVDTTASEFRTNASMVDPLFTFSFAGSFVGTSPQRGGGAAAAASASSSASAAAAAAAAAKVRVSMECGYPWGSATASSSTVAGATMAAALRVAAESPGLVLAWVIVPLPATVVATAAAIAGGDTAAATAAAPEHVVVVLPLVCDAAVTTLLAHPFEPSTLLGGTRCGRIVQWSMTQAWSSVEPRRLVERALATTGTATTLLLPPQRPAHSSFPSPQAHQAAVLRLAVHGDASCHHLYSVSQEGKVCTWPALQPRHPTASCMSYLGIRPMGSIGVTAQFAERAGTDAMTKVFIGTTSGALLVGANRDAKSIELQYYGPPRALPTSSTVVRTLDVTATSAYPTALTRGEAAAAAASTAEHPGGPELSGASTVPSPSTAAAAVAAGVRRAPPSAAPPPPHRGRVVSMALQTATDGLRGRDCVVSSATDGGCVAWFDRSVVPLEGFSAPVTSVCWSPTRSGVLAAGDASGLVTVWNVAVSILYPAATVSLQDAGRRARGSATSDGVLWVASGPGDAVAGGGGGGGGGVLYGDEADEADVADGDGADASLGQADVVGAAVSVVVFSRDGQWLFASTASGYVHTIRLCSSLV